MISWMFYDFCPVLRARSEEIAQREPLPAILFVHGVQDEAFNIQDVEVLYNALKVQYEQVHHPERLSIKVFQNLKHAIDLAANSLPSQRADIVEMEKDTAVWFKQFL
jgi:hypothetical protein